MARVVQRRNSPPYLVVTFAFLFVISLALAVLFYLRADDLRQRLDIQEQETQSMEQPLKTAQAQLDELTRYMTGQTVAPEAAISRARNVVTKVEEGMARLEDPDAEVTVEMPGLVRELEKVFSEYKAKWENLRQRESRIKELESQLSAKNEELAKLTGATLDTVEALKTAMQETQTKLEEAQKTHQERLGQMEDAQASTREELQGEISKLQKRTEQLTLEIQEKKSVISRLEEQLVELRTQRGEQDAAEIANRADGEILKIATDGNVCYINLGANQGIEPGMTFAVYDPTAGRDDPSKGRLRVSSSYEGFSECRIVSQNETNPIDANDIVANLAYDPNQQMVFVVKGEFDLYGDGPATAQGRQEVIRAIKRFGGKVMDEVTPETDYVVMGAEPAKPSAPPEGADPVIQKTYQDQLARYQEYMQTQQLAGSMRIPILNTNRFLDLTGYAPEQRPQ
jgi:peptidoglycan hydrolase CwlO-like protein